MFHVEHGKIDAHFCQPRRRFSTRNEHLCAASVQVLKHTLLVMAIQLRCQVIQRRRVLPDAQPVRLKAITRRAWLDHATGSHAQEND
jgi:hypothetical protein